MNKLLSQITELPAKIKALLSMESIQMSKKPKLPISGGVAVVEDSANNVYVLASNNLQQLLQRAVIPSKKNHLVTKIASVQSGGKDADSEVLRSKIQSELPNYNIRFVVEDNEALRGILKLLVQEETRSS